MICLSSQKTWEPKSAANRDRIVLVIPWRVNLLYAVVRMVVSSYRFASYNMYSVFKQVAGAQLQCLLRIVGSIGIHTVG